MSNVQVCTLSYALSNLLLILLSIFFHFRCTFYPLKFIWVFFTSSMSLLNMLSFFCLLAYVEYSYDNSINGLVS